ncbi:DUF615 domain-containing protein [Exilibacterium tricleocarpae]|uniref:Dual-action ribosomal maturation protein DarP n=1 Tax=Exilibacterium tricleocarpae TaxID=2591008 RepID=A0A545TSG7_9GAMM|nr:ribosome biogenesis factor YjgA [Exilibacterium tricleocarpae]TQV80168.1 DUF615 domain-containing protein [Exilibacterium tricleocarpae]
MSSNNDEFSAEETQPKSKTQLKKEMQALQDLGTALVGLSDKQLAQIPLEGELAEAIHQARRIRHREGKRRQLQFIGKLMRNTDVTAIDSAYKALMEKNHHHIRRQHLTEQWRDRLIAEGNPAVTVFLQEYPHGDSQHLRQLVRGASKEKAHNKPPAQARKLFRYLLEVIGEM